jgi:hypothetical protein
LREKEGEGGMKKEEEEGRKKQVRREEERSQSSVTLLGQKVLTRQYQFGIT